VDHGARKARCHRGRVANRKYAILLGRAGGVGASPGKTALDMLDLGNPDMDWVKIANGMGVEAARAVDRGDLRRPVRDGQPASRGRS
jgi:thiamine pyrophosphate-dependent acetolactate synthase large subunit-like protein